MKSHVKKIFLIKRLSIDIFLPKYFFIFDPNTKFSFYLEFLEEIVFANSFFVYMLWILRATIKSYVSVNTYDKDCCNRDTLTTPLDISESGDDSLLKTSTEQTDIIIQIHHFCLHESLHMDSPVRVDLKDSVL